MTTVKCTATLISDKTKYIDIEIGKDGKTFYWNVLKSGGGSLRLSATGGSWDMTGDMLSLWYEMKGEELKKYQKKYTSMKSLITLIMFDVKASFYEDIVKNGKTYTAENAGLYNDNPSQKEVSCKLSRMN